jgi:SAM-dependent methyltransferase
MNKSAESRIDATHLMQRVHAEVAKRSSKEFAATGTSRESLIPADSDAMVPRLVDAQGPAPPDTMRLTLPIVSADVDSPIVHQLADGRYALQDLLCHQDRDFIHVAYLAVLGRPPDANGFDTYLRLLRSGSSKLEVIGYLHESPEGRQAGRSIRGLAVHNFMAKLVRLPVIGIVGRFVEALRTRDATERQQRILTGYIFAQLEQSRNATESSQHLVNRALAELESGYTKLGAYAATKSGYDALAQVTTFAQSLGRTVNALHALVDRKANGDETFGAVKELNDSIRSLEHRKADAYELTRLAAETDEFRSTVRSLNAVKADVDVVNELHRHLVTQLETKADRSETLNEILACREMSARLVEILADQKTELSRLNEAHQIHSAILATKPDRHEFTDLTNRLVELIQCRSTREEVAQVETQLRDAIHDLSAAKADRTLLDTATNQLLGAVDAVRLGAHRSLEDSVRVLQDRIEVLGDVKTERAAFNATVAESETKALDALASIVHQKVDYATFEAKSVEIHAALLSLNEKAREAIDAAYHRINEAIDNLAVSKVDRSVLDNAIAESFAAIKQLEYTVNTLAPSIVTKSFVDGALTESQVHTQAVLDSMRQSVASSLEGKADRAAVDVTHDLTRDALARVNSQNGDLKRNLLDQERRLGLLLDEARRRLPKPIAVEQIETMLLEEDHILDSMYASFEDIFRGTREDIKQRQTIYLPYMKGANAGSSSTPIIDIGCGRGEWLEVLRDAGLHGRGADINRVFLAGCRAIDLDVVESDGVAFLRSLKAKSVGAVTSFHLVEHLDQKTLIALFDAAFHVLKPGGIAIFETPNPRNLQVGSHTFYMDPTHRHPLPPELLKYLMEARGFGEIEIKELHPPPPENRITEGAPMVKDTLNRFFFSAQDYAVIGKKS